MYLVISEPARGHSLLDVVAPTRVNLVARATVVPQHATSEAARQKERHCSGRPRGDTFIPIAIETYGALLSQRDEFMRDRARRAFPEHGVPSPSISVLVTWFEQRVAVTLQRAQARALHARTACLEATSSLPSTLPARLGISWRLWGLLKLLSAG